MAKNKKEKPEEQKVVFASSNLEMLNDVFKELGLESFEEQIKKAAAEAVAANNGSSSPTTEEGQDG
tara:strand:+ start:452 stop:649 length:198 start_codon:yes stop_codon:yes gene_type:complete